MNLNKKFNTNKSCLSGVMPIVGILLLITDENDSEIRVI